MDGEAERVLCPFLRTSAAGIERLCTSQPDTPVEISPFGVSAYCTTARHTSCARYLDATAPKEQPGVEVEPRVWPPDDGTLGDDSAAGTTALPGNSGTLDSLGASRNMPAPGSENSASDLDGGAHPPVITDPADKSIIRAGDILVSGEAMPDCRLELFDYLQPVGRVETDESGRWSLILADVSVGEHLYYCQIAAGYPGESLRSNLCEITVVAREEVTQDNSGHFPTSGGGGQSSVANAPWPPEPGSYRSPWEQGETDSRLSSAENSSPPASADDPWTRLLAQTQEQQPHGGELRNLDAGFDSVDGWREPPNGEVSSVDGLPVAEEATTGTEVLPVQLETGHADQSEVAATGTIDELEQTGTGSDAGVHSEAALPETGREKAVPAPSASEETMVLPASPMDPDGESTGPAYGGRTRHEVEADGGASAKREPLDSLQANGTGAGERVGGAAHFPVSAGEQHYDSSPPPAVVPSDALPFSGLTEQSDSGISTSESPRARRRSGWPIRRAVMVLGVALLLLVAVTAILLAHHGAPRSGGAIQRVKATAVSANRAPSPIPTARVKSTHGAPRAGTTRSSGSWTFPRVHVTGDAVMLIFNNPNKVAVIVRVITGGRVGTTAQKVQIPAQSGAEMGLDFRSGTGPLRVQATRPVFAQRFVSHHGSMKSFPGKPGA